MNKIIRLILISFIAVFINGCTGANILTPEPYLITPTATAITPTMELSSQAEVQQSDARENWTNSDHAQAGNTVDCYVCHQIQNGLATKDIAWRNQETGQYESLADSNGLCTKCHPDADTAEKAHSDKACVDCHNPHSLTASCLNCHKQIKQAAVIAPSTPTDGHPNDTPFCEGSGCHSIATQAAQSPMSTHGSSHANVACEDCHDADGLQVGPTQDGSVWLLWREVEISGKKTLMPYQSHNLQFEVDCDRCHFEGNPWNLRAVSNNELGN